MRPETVPVKDTLWTLLDGRALDTPCRVTLSTGRESNFYFDCKLVTLSSDGAPLVGDAFLDKLALLPEPPVDAVGGRTLGADPIVGAMMLRAHAREQKLEGFYVRDKVKEHGTKQLVENVPRRGTRVVVVDDVVTTGASAIEAIDAAEKVGCKVIAVIALVDRLEEDGAANIRARVPHYYPLYTREDFPCISESDDCLTTKSAQPSRSERVSTFTTSSI